MTKLIEGRSYYRPFEHPWAYDLYKKSESMHWLPEEVEFKDDIRDWNFKLTDAEKSLLTNLFRFFTQADCDVASGYREIYMPYLGKHPELGMMMMSFANREAVHIDAYSTLIETLGMPESTYEEFLEFKEMADKHEYTSEYTKDDPSVFDLLLGLAVYSAFTEGMQLFSSFAILMNFERMGKMKGMSNIVRWSIRDETLHVEGMTKLFKTLFGEVKENNWEWEDQALLRGTLRGVASKMVELEDAFIDLCFKDHEEAIQGITPEEVKQYIRFIANRRWQQLGFEGELYPDQKNPLEWLDWVINGKEHTNFFEARPTDYSKGTLTGTDDEIEW